MSAKLLTTKEVERLMQLNRVTIYRLIRDAGFPALKLGGQWRFPRDEVERWLEKRGHLVSTSGSEPTQTLAASKVDILVPDDLLRSIEITSLLRSFASAIDLSVLIIGNNGDILLDCAECRHPLCQRVHAKQVCYLAQSVRAAAAGQTHESQVLFDCVPGLHYLRAPVGLAEYPIGYVVMGPFMIEPIDPGDVHAQLADFARRNGADTDVLTEELQHVKCFTQDQVHILAEIFSRAISAMLEVVYRRADANRRLNKIAQLASEV